MSYCIAITKHRKVCGKQVDDNSKIPFCKNHEQQSKISKENLLKILKNIKNDYKQCTRCNNWHIEKGKHCELCKEKNRTRIQEKRKLKTICGLPINPEKTNFCKMETVNNTLYCKKHQYILEIPNFDTNTIQVCTVPSCHRLFYDPDFKTCPETRGIGAKNRENIKENDTRKECKKCKDKENLELGNGYCATCDKKYSIIDRIIESGKMPCSTFHRHVGCLEYRDDINFKSCSVCRKKEADADKKHRDKSNNAVNKFNENQNQEVVKKIISVVKKEVLTDRYNEKVDIHNKKCLEIKGDSGKILSHKEKIIENVECVKWQCCGCDKVCDFKENFFDNNGNQTKFCKVCRDTREKLDKKYRKCMKAKTLKSDKKTRLNKLKETDPDLVSLIYKIHKFSVIEKAGGWEAYKQEEAEWQQQYREKHPEYVKNSNDQQRINFEYKLHWYQTRAKNNMVEWIIDDTHAKDLMKNKCHYCGEMDLINGGNYGDKLMCGIDRKDNDKGYVYGNVVSCCRKCNYMKWIFNYDQYLNKIKHILAFFLYVGKKFNSTEHFKNYLGTSLTDYKRRAQKNSLDFSLSNDEFFAMQTQDCYLCGKESNYYHCNGIDRINNNKGYDINNCLPCCGDCNYLKKDITLIEMIRKIYLTGCNLCDIQFDKSFYDDLKQYTETKLKIVQHIKINLINQSIKNKITDTDYEPTNTD